MLYQILPLGDIWSEGMFSVPSKIVGTYLKMASEYQLKALLMVLANGGRADLQTLARDLGCTQSDVQDILAFWVDEGVLVKDGEAPAAAVAPQAVSPTPNAPTPPTQAVSKPQFESLPVPRLSPKDVVAMCNSDASLTELLRNAQEILGNTLSHAEQEMMINMVTYYGLPVEVVLTILQYFKSEKEKGKVIGTGYINAMAKNWAEEGIDSLSAADEKLKSLELTDKMWVQVVSLSGIHHRNPTQKQREMVARWHKDFSIEMIGLACDIMKEHSDKPALNYVDKVLKNWLKKGILTPADVVAEQDRFEKAKEGKIQTAPTYDIDEITRKALLNTEYDI